ncbi:hypothetical protein [endosymbiont DhMRE of Dentiscutata heterogama]|uniref:hypothetical protein n=1 Tax=endosymbiont DhMRE of Dentiscutata heterogama TaxID=1609546 RepID=UPI002AD29744|nr:hypothetical protein [endosymbiont DhMRE of Dentiscutata heterogama]
MNSKKLPPNPKSKSPLKIKDVNHFTLTKIPRTKRKIKVSEELKSDPKLVEEKLKQK